MQTQAKIILQLTDSVTGRACALRVEPSDADMPLRSLLDKYLKCCPLEQLIAEGRVTADSAETIQSLQDLVYVSADSGQLLDMFAGIEFKQGERTLNLEDAVTLQTAMVNGEEIDVIDVAIDRLNVGYDRNWTGFNRRRWDRHADVYDVFVSESLRREFSEKQARDILRLDTSERKLGLLRSLAKRIWESPFENYSRFVGKKLRYKTGDETVRNIIDGSGGICSEKVQALKFLTDHYGLSSEYILAGAETQAPVPEEKLRELLTTFDFRFSKRYMRYWQHTALLYNIDGGEILVDVTNGNIPFLFLNGKEARRVLDYEDKQAVPVRMAVYEEDFYYHRVSQDIPEKLFFAMEGWIPDSDLVQVFDNELGLCITKDFFVAPVVYKSSNAFERLERQYAQACERAGLAHEISAEWELSFELGCRFTEQEPRAAEKIMLAREHLLNRYDEFHGPDHEAGLIVINLAGCNRLGCHS